MYTVPTMHHAYESKIRTFGLVSCDSRHGTVAGPCSGETLGSDTLLSSQGGLRCME
jgi:hypothetical protein